MGKGIMELLTKDSAYRMAGNLLQGGIGQEQLAKVLLDIQKDAIRFCTAQAVSLLKAQPHVYPSINKV